MRTIDSIFQRYYYLVEQYANKIYNTSKISYDKEDVKQELSLRLFNAIVTYLRNNRNGLKQMPLKYYLHLVMKNKVIDIVKQIQREKIVFVENYFDVKNQQSLNL